MQNDAEDKGTLQKTTPRIDLKRKQTGCLVRSTRTPPKVRQNPVLGTKAKRVASETRN